MAILALVMLSFLGTRTEALINASEARNWRLARELAQELLSELAAGAREIPPDAGRVASDRYEDFAYQILVGEDAISQYDANDAAGWGPGANRDRSQRLAWEQQRDDQRLARQKGMQVQAYKQQRIKDEWKEEREQSVPSEDDLEDVLVVVYFPNVRITQKDSDPESSFKLKAKISTLAIEGLTPEEAQALAQDRGQAGQGPLTGGGNQPERQQ